MILPSEDDMGEQRPERIVILGAAGRDFHDFNVCFRDEPDVEVVAFTATQIPRIAGRAYPPELAGPRYPRGIPIVAESELERIVARDGVDTVVLSYSDLHHREVMHLASRSLAAGASFRLLSPSRTMLRARRPVVAVTAVRTGAGKSQVSRRVAAELRAAGLRVVAIRHPMPYGDLVAMRVQRFATDADLDAWGDRITIEEREEYEPHIATGTIVYAGVDYQAILVRAQEECDVIVWDGGNNDTPFLAPDLWITVADPHRAGHELDAHPGEVNLRRADIVVVNKVDSAPASAVDLVRRNIAATNPRAVVVETDSRVSADDPSAIAGKRVVVIEDGPSLTHGELATGAGFVAAQRLGAREIVDPRPWAVGSIRAALDAWPHLGPVLPAMGYFPEQLADLAETIRRVPCDTVVVGTPIDLRRLLDVTHVPVVRVRYELADRSPPLLGGELRRFVAGLGRT
jgi:predicted GTPase